LLHWVFEELIFRMLDMAAVQTMNHLTAPATLNGAMGNKDGMEQPNSERIPKLVERFGVLKRDIIKPQDERAVTDSYQRLKDALATEADRIDDGQQSAFPEVEWSKVVNNGCMSLHY
jgi:hypothetical protein